MHQKKFVVTTWSIYNSFVAWKVSFKNFQIKDVNTLKYKT
jgi:hypothetical protein